MNYFMVRSIDHAGYYETRLLLMVVGILVAGWRAVQGDRRYLVLFGSGVFFQALLEELIRLLGLRGPAYRLSVFGVILPPALATLYQGCAEGGILSLMSFWFADLVLSAPKEDQAGRWLPYVMMCALILALATFVGWYAGGQPITSPRPMFRSSAILTLDTMIVSTLLLLWLVTGCFGNDNGNGFRWLGWYVVGAVIYSVLTFEPLHLLGARYIAVRLPDETYAPAKMPAQAGVMAWAHVVEFAAGKMHYFVVPYLLGLVRFSGSRS
jgi:hypothetical protein